ncbi:MAG: MFS transporter [Anaerolineae bacterium]|nr:MFS transporter [Anaerolineae bacterium]
MNITSRRNMVILSLSLVIITIGFGMIIPLFPFYIERMGAGGGEMGVLIAIGALTELIFSPAWGSLSDRVGRKPILMIGVFGYAIFSILFGIATELWMLFAARALSGVLSAAAMAAATAYIGDSTSEEDRGSGMGILGAMAGLGLILGPGFGGWLATISLLTPFLVASGLSLFTVILILFLLPESLPAQVRREATGNVARLHTGTLWHALSSSIGILLFMAFLSSFGLANFEAIFGLYALEKFNLGPEHVGTILSVVGIVSTVGKLFTGALTRHWGDAVVIKASLLAGSVGFLVLLLASTYLTILLATGFFVLSKTFLRPSIMALTSKEAATGQGMAMGLNNSFMSLGRIVGPIWAGIVFDLNFDYPYLSGAVILFVGFLVSLGTISQTHVSASMVSKQIPKT